MKKSNFYFGLFGVFAFAIGMQSSFAAQRQTFFGGVAGMGAGTGTFQTATRPFLQKVQCHLAVMNPGTTATPQRIYEFTYNSIVSSRGMGDDLYRVKQTTWTYKDTIDDTVLKQCLIQKGSSASVCKPCIGSEGILKAGDVCHLTYTTSAVLNGASDAAGICSGVIKVEDVNADSRTLNSGALLAAGSIAVTQEAMVLGGVLTGAYYASGSHVLESDAADFSNSLNTEISNGKGFGEAMQMNLYCTKACNAAYNVGADPIKKSLCEQNCGYFKPVDNCSYCNKCGALTDDGTWAYCELFGAASGGTLKIGRARCNPTPTADTTQACFELNDDFGWTTLLKYPRGEPWRTNERSKWEWCLSNGNKCRGDSLAVPVMNMNGYSTGLMGQSGEVDFGQVGIWSTTQAVNSLQRCTADPTEFGQAYIFNSAPLVSGTNPLNSCYTAPAKIADAFPTFKFFVPQKDGNQLTGAISSSGLAYLGFAHANPHFTGGSVYEIEIGSGSTICTANSGSTITATHDGKLTSDAYLREKNANYPPELLYCSHRHGQPELFMRVGSVTSFTINGAHGF